MIACGAIAAGQTPRRRTGTAAPKPTPSPTPAPVSSQPQQPADPPPATLAIVNDTSITMADVGDQINATILNDPDLYLRAFYLDPEKEIKEARQRALDARINSLLIAAEAKKRGKSPDEIVENEINAKITPPTEQEIQATFEANRAQLGSDLEKVRPGVVNYLRSQRRQELYEAYLNRLRMTNAVARRADVNTPNLAPGSVLAAVNGDPIRVDMINERMKAYVYKLQMRIYAVQKSAVDRRINDLLLIAEANKRKIGPEEIVRAEITDKLKPPTEAEVVNFYNENKARITGDLAAARPEIASYLQQQQQEKLETALSERLRAGAKVQMLLPEPVPPAINVSASNGPARGDANAAVTVIEFTDFQCSACGAMYPIVEDILKSYGNRVRFVIRDFPLTTLHPNAFRAAQAASAANAQGKFWEYIDILFRNQSTLDSDSLKKYATQIGLDRKRFDPELESGKYDADIRRDIEDGEMYGVEGTPTFFINGVMLTELGGDALRAALEKAFARAGKRTP